jgi:signal transduction histidine kinase
MFKMEKGINVVLKDIFKTMIVAASILIISVFTLYYGGSGYFLETHNSNTVYTIVEDIKDNSFLKRKYFNIDYEIEIEYQGNFFKLENKQFVISNKPVFEPCGLTFITQNNIEIHFPSYAEYKIDEVIIRISLEHGNHAIIIFSIIIFMVVSIYSILYHIMLHQKLKSLHNIKLSAQEYALSERTTSYLVSIMHHKLNTPLKILATKSRVLAQSIFDSDLDDNIKSKAEKDYINIDNALKTIFEITSKLKTFKSATQSELNIYKIFGISIETIEILRDDEFSINVDRKTKLFEIDKNRLSPHEMIQVFINQIKFSIEEMSTEINIKMFYSDDKKIKILFSDNGNPVDPHVIQMVKNRRTLESLDPENRDEYYSDLLLNLSILKEAGGSLKIINSNDNGTTYEIVIPTFKVDLKKIKAKKKEDD